MLSFKNFILVACAFIASTTYCMQENNQLVSQSPEFYQAFIHDALQQDPENLQTFLQERLDTILHESFNQNLFSNAVNNACRSCEYEKKEMKATKKELQRICDNKNALNELALYDCGIGLVCTVAAPFSDESLKPILCMVSSYGLGAVLHAVERAYTFYSDPERIILEDHRKKLLLIIRQQKGHLASVNHIATTLQDLLQKHPISQDCVDPLFYKNLLLDALQLDVKNINQINYYFFYRLGLLEGKNFNTAVFDQIYLDLSAHCSPATAAKFGDIRTALRQLIYENPTLPVTSDSYDTCQAKKENKVEYSYSPTTMRKNNSLDPIILANACSLFL